MVVHMMKWRPWPPLQSKKFEAKIVINSISGLQSCSDDSNDGEKSKNFDGCSSKLRVEIKWKCSKPNGIRSLKKKSVKKNSTSVKELGENGVVHWDEEFKVVCGLCLSKDRVDDGVFLPWVIEFSVFDGSRKDAKTKGPLATPAVINLTEFASLEDTSISQLDMNIPLSMSGRGFKCCPSLCITLRLTELKTTDELSNEVQRPIMLAPISPCFGKPSPPIKNFESSNFKANIRKVISSRKSKACTGEGNSDSKVSTESDSDYKNPFDTDSLDETDAGEFEENIGNTAAKKSCGYGSLVHVNLAGGALDPKANYDDCEFVYYSNKKLKLDSSPAQEVDVSEFEQIPKKDSKFKILSWRKKKLTKRVKGELLLKKDYGEEGGDDIDFDRRQLSSDDSMTFEDSVKSESLFSEFGDDNFAVGSWEIKELSSRDGMTKLTTKVFFASIDQRSERAAGESACTALVAIIADWLHANRGEMPIKSDFDNLIREGSLQWRILCENEDYKEKFPDKHFDLETVLQAKIRPLTVIPEKSFIGFFHPEGLEEECFHFLKDSMSFDDIWGEICEAASKLTRDSEPMVYVVSWNDHFFLLRVDFDAFYIIDTLGERLFEGCDQAFVLKFDNDTIIEKVLSQTPNDENASEEKSVVLGKEGCKEYIKSFLAAIPIRELQDDLKRGMMSSTPLHHRLQIEFNFTAQILQALDKNVDVPVANTEVEVDLWTGDFPSVRVSDVQGVWAENCGASKMMAVVAA